MSVESLEELEGVGSKTADKLYDSGFTSLEAIAVSSPKQLAEQSDIGEQKASKIVRRAREQIDLQDFLTGSDVMERRKEIGKLKTLVPEVDEVLRGGFETQSISELYGEFGSGKSQLTHQLSVNVQLPTEHGGLDGSAIFIDTEDTFRPGRISSMVKGLNPGIIQDLLDSRGIQGSLDDEGVLDELVKDFLDNIHVASAYNSNHQMLLVEKASDKSEELSDSDKPVKLLVVDSLTSHFRAEYIGRGNLAERQQKLNTHLHDIRRFAVLNNSVAVVTNQVQSDPDSFFGDPTKPIGGNIMGHTSTYRIYIKKSKDNKRVIRIVDAPDLPESEAVLRIEEEGLKPE